MLLRLDALGDHFEPEAAPERDDRAHDRGIVGVLGHVAHEALVDLDALHRELLDVAERGIAGAKIVDRDRNAEAVELAQIVCDRVYVLHHDIFGQFQLEAARIEAGLRKDARDLQRHVLLAKLDRRHVDGDPERREAVALPDARVRAGLAQHPFVDRNDEAVFLGLRQEGPRADDTDAWTVPAQKRLDTDDRIGGDVELRLVVENEFLVGERHAQIGFEAHRAARARLHVGGEQAVGVSALPLGLVHCEIRVAQKFVRVGAVVGMNGDANRGGRLHLGRLGIGEGGDSLADARGKLRDVVVGADVGLQDREFVAAETGQRVALAHDLAQPRADRLQKTIADGMAVDVVDGLEAVEVDQMQGEYLVAATRAGDGAAELFGQQRPVGQRRQRIVMREIAQVLFGALVRGNVERGSENAHHRPGMIAQRRLGGEERAATFVDAGQVLFERGQGATRREDELVERLIALGISLADQLGKRTADCGHGIDAEEIRLEGVDEQRAALAVDRIDEHRQRVDHLGQALDGIADRTLARALAVCEFLSQRVGAFGEQFLMAAQREQIARAGDEFVMIDRRIQEVGGAGLERAQAVGALLVDRDDDDGNIGSALGGAQGADEIGAVHLRHFVVSYDEIGGIGGQPVEGLARIAE